MMAAFGPLVGPDAAVVRSWPGCLAAVIAGSVRAAAPGPARSCPVLPGPALPGPARPDRRARLRARG
ncbi:hypothetical protein D7044_03495 [Micromonospora musae]|uniref:Uncharacterized protein n=1 Tax=Micromonospora musae TaxID=1894970 RepID=A0A3A9YDL7_9ACTN|nr:hypothetical protein D7044_03495 [Micromonospora musae]